jgi:hypothetical protein
MTTTDLCRPPAIAVRRRQRIEYDDGSRANIWYAMDSEICSRPSSSLGVTERATATPETVPPQRRVEDTRGVFSESVPAKQQVAAEKAGRAA